ncbi:MAG: ribosomal biogenesis protein [Crenarchaeota archaeon]|nr:ribosomal biogenesis protein [Thermoproteota archaeon]
MERKSEKRIIRALTTIPNRVAVSSSRDPNLRVRQFLNELVQALPRSFKINRGRMSIDELVMKAMERDARYIMYITVRRGNPVAIRFIEVDKERASYRWLPYLIKLIGVKLIVDMPIRRIVKNRARDAVIVSFDYHEVSDIFSQIFNIPTLYTRNLDELRGQYDTIIVVRPVYDRPDFTCEIQMLDGEDFGPRGPIIRISRVYYVTGRELVPSPDIAELLGE